MEALAKHNFARISPQKARLVAVSYTHLTLPTTHDV